MTAIFAWTFEGVMQALLLTIVVLIFLVLGFVVLLGQVATWWEGRK